MYNELMDSVNYLDWYFREDDGGADKDAVKAYDKLRKNVFRVFSDEVGTIVHCEDCKWLSFNVFMGVCVCGCGKVNGFVCPDSYCSWGELREEKAKQNDRK